MKLLFTTLLMILTCYIINGQNILTGKITDKVTGETLPGSTIYIPELKTGDIADKNGTYEIDNLPRTKVIVQVSFLGYKSVVQSIDMATTTSMNFVMEQAITGISRYQMRFCKCLFST